MKKVIFLVIALSAALSLSGCIGPSGDQPGADTVDGGAPMQDRVAVDREVGKGIMPAHRICGGD